MDPVVREHLKRALEGKKILLGISGSIAAFKACDIVRYLRECGAVVRCVLTDSATRFVTPLTLETLTGEPVYTSLWSDDKPDNQTLATSRGNHHIDIARWADLALIAPATANTIGKLAQGLADDLLSTELLAFHGPVLIAPAMNPAMYAHPAVQANTKLLMERGCKILGPAHGVTSCGEEGLGRMLEPEDIVERVAETFYAPLNGKRVLVTLGPTRSPLDPVRYITNRSSGLMGAALCWAAVQQGYEVTAICGPTDACLPSGINVVRVNTAREMADAALAAWPEHDVFLAAAAVLDWDVKAPSTSKLKKSDGAPQVEFSPNPDILAEVTKRKRADQFVLGFAAETDQPVEYALAKLKAKGCDAIFANDVSQSDRGFESMQNAGWWITASETQEIPLSNKSRLAHALLSRVVHQGSTAHAP